MDSGYIRLSRKFFNNAYWEQDRTFSFSEAWLDLIQLARFEEKQLEIVLSNGKEIKIGRGEMRASLRFLSKRWGWGVDKTKRFIDKHIERKELQRRIEQGESILKLCNYDTYNPISNTNKYSGQTPTSTNNNKEKERRIININSEKKILSERLYNSLESLLSQQIYLETICMNNKISKSALDNYLKLFFIELENRGEEWKDEKDAKFHFSNWLRTELNKNKNGTEKAEKPATYRF